MSSFLLRENTCEKLLLSNQVGSSKVRAFSLFSKHLADAHSLLVAPAFFKVADVNKISKRKKQEKIEPLFDKFAVTQVSLSLAFDSILQANVISRTIGDYPVSKILLDPRKLSKFLSLNFVICFVIIAKRFESN